MSKSNGEPRYVVHETTLYEVYDTETDDYLNSCESKEQAQRVADDFNNEERREENTNEQE